MCGIQEMSVESLMCTTTYHEPLKAGHVLVTNFWECVRRMSDEERSLLLRFISGRTRPPISINLHQAPESPGEQEDDRLPTSHTCFYQLYLPRYSSLEAMQRKLLYAIHNCTAIDTDMPMGLPMGLPGAAAVEINADGCAVM